MSQAKSKLRVGVVGLGMGKYHIEKYLVDQDCEITAVCDPNTSLLKERAQEFGVENRFTDAAQMFASGMCDVVSIATPNKLHAPLTIAALDAGLHVLCEKPMAMNAAEAESMVAAAERNDKKLAIHFNHRMNPSVHRMAEMRKSGELGEVYYARTVWHRQKGIPGRESFLSKQNAGGGCMIDLGVHMLDQTLFVLGYPKIRAVSAEVFTRFHQTDHPDLKMDVEDFAAAKIRFESGASLAMEISWASHHDMPQQTIVQIYGDKAGLIRRTEDYKEQAFCMTSRNQENKPQTRDLTGEPWDVNVQTDLLDAIRNDREPLCSAEHGLVTMRVLDALYRSSEERREIVL